MNVWIEKTNVKGIAHLKDERYKLGRALCSPQKSKDGKDIYKNMRKVKAGDIIIHLIDNEVFCGVSKAVSTFSKNEIREGSNWDGPVYVVDLEAHTLFENPLPKHKILNEDNRYILEKISEENEVFYNKRLDLRQGAYLTPCSIKLLNLINNEYRKINDNKNIPFVEEVLQNITFDDITKVNNLIVNNNLEYNLNQILYGPPGTGKTYYSILYAVAICDNKSIEKLEEMPYEQNKIRFDELKREERICFTTFHQSLCYEEFVEGLKPKVNNGKNNYYGLAYEYSSGIFKDFCKIALKEKNKPHVFIIDEINRGNITKIFGGLITLLEPNRRIGEKEETYVTLPYTKTKFGIPNNLYIIGTMNTADSPIALIDKALRRKFYFAKMLPDPTMLVRFNINRIGKIDLVKMLSTINERIEILYDRDHTIGHAYFIQLIESPTIDKLAIIFRRCIIPLLQEYFYNDCRKIQLILGDNKKSSDQYKFILDHNVDINKIFKGNIDIDVLKKKYTIQEDAFNKEESYIQIYQ